MATVKFVRSPDPRVVKVIRNEDVSDDFWLLARANWGQSGADPRTSLAVPVEHLLRRTSWVQSACERYGVTVEVDEPTTLLLARVRTEAEQLNRILGADQAESEEDGSDLLEGGRFTRTLKDFQIRDLGKLASLPHGANFSVPGAGKTSVQLALYEVSRQRGLIDQMLVVAPLAAFEAWEDDIGVAFQPTPNTHRFDGARIPFDAEVVLINYQRLANGFNELSSWMGQRKTALVLDEAHRMKRGRDGEWGRLCLDLSRLALRRDILTGTPAPQHPSDLIALLDFLWPGQASRILPSKALAPIPSPSDVAEVSPAIKPLFVRTTKHELRLRDPIVSTELVPLTGLQLEIYDALRGRMSQLLHSSTDHQEAGRLGQIVMYLIEAATNPALLAAGGSEDDPIAFRHPPLPVSEGDSLMDLIADYAHYETPAKFLTLDSMLENKIGQDGKKVLVWSNFVRNLTALERRYERYSPALVHGGISAAASGEQSERERELDRFRHDPECKVLFANPASIGEGVSLHHCCHEAIYLDLTFNAGHYLQSVDRIHRLGLPDDVDTRISVLMTADTIDTRCWARVANKAENLGRMLDDPALLTLALPDEEDPGLPIAREDREILDEVLEHVDGFRPRP